MKIVLEGAGVDSVGVDSIGGYSSWRFPCGPGYWCVPWKLKIMST